MHIFDSLENPELITMIQGGNVGVLPTDTVYGLVGSARNQQVVNRIFTVKKRERKPGTIIAANIHQLIELGVKKRYLTAVEHYWPNPLSIQIPHSPDYLSQQTNSVAVRIPDNPELMALLEQTGPLMTTSANAPDQPTATNIDAAKEYFSETVDFYVDIGDIGDRPSSTIIRIVDDAIEILRPGAVRIDESGRITT